MSTKFILRRKSKWHYSSQLYYTQYSCRRERFSIPPVTLVLNRILLPFFASILAFFEKKLAFFWSPFHPCCPLVHDNQKVAKCQKKLWVSPLNCYPPQTPQLFMQNRDTPDLSYSKTPTRAQKNANNIYYHHPLLVMLNWYIVLSLLKKLKN